MKFLCVLILCAAAAAQSVPTGFVLEQVQGGIQGPTGVAELPDGRLVIVTKFGRFMIAAGGSLELLEVMPVASSSENGLWAVEVDPLWPSEPFIYYCYSSLEGQWRLERRRVSGDLTAPNSTSISLGPPYVLLETPNLNPQHNGGCLRFAPDGMLLVSMGDDRDDCTAADPTTLEGSLLRLDVAPFRSATGSGPPPRSALAAPGNPLSGPNAELVWAYGLRNPWRFEVDPLNGEILLADVGDGAQEEIDHLTAPGAFLGWPHLEGNHSHLGLPCAPPAATAVAPIWTWAHASGGPEAITLLGGRYRNIPGAPYAFGPEYEGDVFALEMYSGSIVRLRSDAQGVWSPAPAVPGQPSASFWGQGFVRALEARPSRDGSLLVVVNVGPLRGIQRLRPVLQSDLVVVSGANQCGTGGEQLPEPLVVEARDSQGTPVSGVSIHFSLLVGDGSLSATTVNTDAQGRAEVLLTLGAAAGVDHEVRASATSFPSANFVARWRGLKVDWSPGSSELEIEMKGIGVQSPLLLAADIPVGAPWAQSPYGPIWTSILEQPTQALVLDGLGLFGPAIGGMVSDSDGEWSLTLEQIPPLGLSFVFQGYAVDFGLLPAGKAFIVSNPVTVAFP